MRRLASCAGFKPSEAAREESHPMPNVPEGAKKPADHQPKKSGVDAVDVEIRGIKLKLDPTLLDDFELMDDIARVEDGDVTRAAKILRRLVSAEERAKLLETARDKKTGRVGVEAGVGIVMELFEAAAPNS